MLILTGHKRMVNSVRFSPDGRKVLSTGGYSTDEARLFDLTSGKVQRTHDEQVAVWDMDD